LGNQKICQAKIPSLSSGHEFSGYTSNGRDIELDKLREAWKLLNDLLKNLANAEACLKNLDLKLTGDHIKVAKWNVEEVKKAIAVVGQAKPQRSSS
jgi:hypothetical protein